MNFLAHLFLSGDDPEVMIGNFIADHVKGNRKDAYPDGIRKGIELHRAIDHFTDTHPVTAFSRQLLYDSQSKYSGVVVDLFYDHFLAANFNAYSTVELHEFIQQAYSTLSDNQAVLPEQVRIFLPMMIERNWLGGYVTVDGIGRSLKGLSKRVNFPNRMHEAEEDLRRLYPALEAHFRAFFPELINFADIRRNAAVPDR
ncbi:MAG: ACP phosphodiesterase [Bacteroidota bacterium]